MQANKIRQYLSFVCNLYRICREQIELKKKLVIEDCTDWGEATDDPLINLNLIGGVDISFPKGDTDHACACLVVLTFPELEVGSCSVLLA